jgi:hypothetical protein
MEVEELRNADCGSRNDLAALITANPSPGNAENAGNRLSACNRATVDFIFRNPRSGFRN